MILYMVGWFAVKPHGIYRCVLVVLNISSSWVYHFFYLSNIYDSKVFNKTTKYLDKNSLERETVIEFMRRMLAQSRKKSLPSSIFFIVITFRALMSSYLYIPTTALMGDAVVTFESRSFIVIFKTLALFIQRLMLNKFESIDLSVLDSEYRPSFSPQYNGHGTAFMFEQFIYLFK